MKEPIVSVIIPIYNTARYLDNCIQSVVNQTIDDLQIILVDDGSTDESPAICDKWVEADNRIQVIHKSNEGLGYTRNTGLSVAIGKFISFLDSDDTLDHNTYEVCIEKMEKYNADACYFGRKTMDESGVFHINTNIPEKLLYKGKEIKTEYAKTYFGSLPTEEEHPYIQASSCCAFYRRSIIEENQIRFCSEREYLSEDLFFNIDVCRTAQCIVIIPENFYNYTYNGNSLTKKYSDTRFQRCKLMYSKLIEYTEGYMELDKVNIRIANKILGYTRMIVIDAICNSTTPYVHVKEIGNDKQIREIYQKISETPTDGMTKLYILLMRSKQYWLLVLLYRLKYR